MNKSYDDGTPYARKLARTVWSGGKAGDYIKGLPIAIAGYADRTESGRLYAWAKRSGAASNVQEKSFCNGERTP